MITSKLTKEEKKLHQEENHKANERMLNLVVKIISWNSGLMEGAAITSSNKITQDEWKRYKKHLFEISKVDNQDKIKQKIDKIYEAIKANGGFE